MKYRNDFVTNSSSSSFLISKKVLDEDQLNAIRLHVELGQELGIPWSRPEDEWEIRENDNFVTGFTIVDNFDFHEFLEKIGVPDEDIVWDDWEFNLETIDAKKIENKSAEQNWRENLHKLQER